jgi:hypothetical protein
MKKILLFLILAVVANSVFLFSDEPDETNTPNYIAESWYSLGYEHGFFTERSYVNGKAVETFTSSPGIHFSHYSFSYGMNVGMFAGGFFGFPVLEVVEKDGRFTRNNFSDSVLNMQVGLIVGPGFRIPMERVSFRFAFGFGFLLSTNLYTEYIRDYGDYPCTKQAFSFGVGGDIGTKIDITDTIFMSVGSIFTYDFRSHLEMKMPYEKSSGWVNGYGMFGARLYVTIGMNLFWKYPEAAK